jgi:hypothetical protein|tara:strand:- start:12499 stop:12837 length:339 start_codon:yes stop_codon:yes gene_type:complete
LSITPGIGDTSDVRRDEHILHFPKKLCKREGFYATLFLGGFVLRAHEFGHTPHKPEQKRKGVIRDFGALVNFNVGDSNGIVLELRKIRVFLDPGGENVNPFQFPGRVNDAEH